MIFCAPPASREPSEKIRWNCPENHMKTGCCIFTLNAFPQRLSYLRLAITAKDPRTGVRINITIPHIYLLQKHIMYKAVWHFVDGYHHWAEGSQGYYLPLFFVHAEIAVTLCADRAWSWWPRAKSYHSAVQFFLPKCPSVYWEKPYIPLYIVVPYRLRPSNQAPVK